MSSEALNQRFLYIPRSALVISTVLHLLVPTGYVTVKVLEKFGIHLFPERKSRMEMYQNFIQVDVVGLPDAPVKDSDSVDATLPVVEKPKAVTEPAPDIKTSETVSPVDMATEEKAAKAKKEAEAKAEAAKVKAEKEAALKKLQEEAEREKALKSLQANTGKKGRKKVAGNILSKGTATTGMIGTAKDRYTSIIAQRIKEHFNIFPWQRKKGLVSVVFIDLYPTGRIKAKKLLKPSSDATFDSAVLQAVDDAQPMPIPEDLSLISGGITIEFRPEG